MAEPCRLRLCGEVVPMIGLSGTTGKHVVDRRTTDAQDFRCPGLVALNQFQDILQMA